MGPDLMRAGEIGCEAYGGGAPLEDPVAKVQVLDAFVPGGADARGTLRIALSTSRPAAGFSARLRIAGAAMDGTRAVDRTGTIDSRLPMIVVRSLRRSQELDGPLYCALLSSPTTAPEDTVWIPPGNDVVAVEIEGCVFHGTAAGAYPIVIEAAEIIDAETARAIRPVLGNGLLTVGAYVSGNCDPEGLNAVFTIGSGSAPPGGSVALPFTIRASKPAEGYSYSVDFDEEVLRAEEVEVVWERPDGRDYRFQLARINNDNATPGNHGVDEGYIYGAAAFSSGEPVVLMPANTDVLALQFHFTVRPETGAGGTEVRFIDGPAEAGQPGLNVLVIDGRGVDLTLADSFVWVHGFVAIIDDIATFVRGDANGDGAMNVSDAITTLDFLFLGKGRPHCFDAADFDDSGEIDIADPIGTLDYLFQGGRPPGPPFRATGEDPTPDGMTCLTR
jgi:hypothetical protein